VLECNDSAIVDKRYVNGKSVIIPYIFTILGESMMRFAMLSIITILMLSGCTAKEFGDGVGDGINDVKRVIRGNNN
jgi:hypothetical protein